MSRIKANSVIVSPIAMTMICCLLIPVGSSSWDGPASNPSISVENNSPLLDVSRFLYALIITCW